MWPLFNNVCTLLIYEHGTVLLRLQQLVSSRLWLYRGVDGPGCWPSAALAASVNRNIAFVHATNLPSTAVGHTHTTRGSYAHTEKHAVYTQCTFLFFKDPVIPADEREALRGASHSSRSRAKPSRTAAITLTTLICDVSQLERAVVLLHHTDAL